MRLSILINMPDPTAGHDYAVLRLDIASRGWSVDELRGIELPATGDLHDVKGVLTLCECGSDNPLVTLFNMRVDRRGSVSSAQGGARWQSMARRESVDGHWRLRAVERTESKPEVTRVVKRTTRE